jgi:hypothetical protein
MEKIRYDRKKEKLPSPAKKIRLVYWYKKKEKQESY